MRYFTAVLLALVFINSPAQADEIETLCKNAFDQSPALGVAYVPDVDVHGNPVVPADLYERPKLIPDVILIPLTVDLAQRLGTLPQGTEMRSQLGTLQIYDGGKVVLNGQDLSLQAQALCEGKDVEKAVLSVSAKDDVKEQEVVPLSPASLSDDQKQDKEDVIFGEGE